MCNNLLLFNPCLSCNNYPNTPLTDVQPTRIMLVVADVESMFDPLFIE